MRESLEEIGAKMGTDKSSARHDYLRFYEEFLARWRDEPIKFIEFGINTGASLRTWEAWFTKAEVIGVDIKPKWVAQEFERAKTIRGDCGDRAFLRKFAKKHRPFILLDDASHFWSHQIAAFEECFEYVEPGGFFIMEDLNTSFGVLRRDPFNDQRVDAFTYFSKLNTLVGGKGWMHPLRMVMPESEAQRELAPYIDYMAFYRDTLIIRKRQSKYLGPPKKAKTASK